MFSILFRMCFVSKELNVTRWYYVQWNLIYGRIDRFVHPPSTSILLSSELLATGGSSNPTSCLSFFRLCHGNTWLLLFPRLPLWLVSTCGSAAGCRIFLFFHVVTPCFQVSREEGIKAAKQLNVPYIEVSSFTTAGLEQMTHLCCYEVLLVDNDTAIWAPKKEEKCCIQ